MRKQRYIVLALVLIALVQHSCQVIYFVLPQKYEEQIKTKQKIQKTAKLQKQQKKEEQAREEKLRKQWLEMQSDATRDQMERLEKNAKKINKKRRRQFFLWRWLGL